MRHNPKPARLILFVFLVLSFLALVIPISFSLGPLQHEFWNMGHALGFAFLYFLLPRAFVNLGKLSPARYYLFSLLSAAAIALATETLQQFIPGRNPSYIDVYLDILGAFLGCTAHILTSKNQRKHFFALFVVGILALFYPSHKVFIDVYIQHQQFPILSEISYRSELSRWAGDNHKVLCVGPNFSKPYRGKTEYQKYAFTPSNSVLLSNNLIPADVPAEDRMCGLHVPIKNEQYSGASLQKMVTNWNGFKHLQIELYAEGTGVLTVRVDDNDHAPLFEYHDRFNQTVQIEPGMNNITLDLALIQHAPHSRQMNMQKISSVGIFSSSPHELSSFVIFKVELLP